MIDFKSALCFSLDDLATLFNAAFTGYIGGDIHFTAASMARFLSRDNVDLNLSQVILRGEQPVGFGLVARQGWTSRLAAFGIVPTASGKGVGRAAMLQMLAQARERGDRFYELEVIEQNRPAVRLYEGVGFHRLRRLVGYRLQPEAAAAQAASASLAQVDIPEVARQIILCAEPDLPWQAAGYTIAHYSPPDAGFTLNGAFVVVSNPAGDTIALRALVVPPNLRRQGRASRLLRALFAQYPGKSWVVPAIYPEDIGAELAACLGFECQSISQFHMRASL